MCETGDPLFFSAPAEPLFGFRLSEGKGERRGAVGFQPPGCVASAAWWSRSCAAAASAHQPTAFSLKVSQRKEQVAYLVCLCSPPFPAVFGFFGPFRQHAGAYVPVHVRSKRSTDSQEGFSGRESHPDVRRQRSVHSVISSLVLYCTYRQIYTHTHMRAPAMSFMLRRKGNRVRIQS